VRVRPAVSDTTVFGFAQNKANMAEVAVGTVLSADTPVNLLRSQPFPRAAKKITGDLQWKTDAVCNVRPCKNERTAGRARAMGKAMDNNGRTIEEQWNSREPNATYSCNTTRQRMAP
jgi:hypothetical protein